MRYLGCSYMDLLLLPQGYILVIEKIAERERLDAESHKR